eukprot:1351192-Pleurochrysis_carterae.AAC.4
MNMKWEAKRKGKKHFGSTQRSGRNCAKHSAFRRERRQQKDKMATEIWTNDGMSRVGMKLKRKRSEMLVQDVTRTKLEAKNAAHRRRRILKRSRSD